MPQRLPLRALVLVLWVAAHAAAFPAAAVTRRAFVTSDTGTGNLTSWPGAGGQVGLAAGDAICRARATAAALPNASTYRAWLSTSVTDAYCHVQGLSGKKANGCGGANQPGGGPWYLVNGITPFTASLQALTANGVIYRPVIFDENGDEPLDELGVWTGTHHAGTGVSQTCADWTAGGSSFKGQRGHAKGSAVEWTADSVPTCNLEARLLCLEPGTSDEVQPPTWAPGAITFVTSVKGTGDLAGWPQAGGEDGLEGGDAICRSLAAEAGLPAPELFIAWLSTSAADAVERVSVDAPFRRLDGLPIAFGRADLVDGFASNTIHVDERGSYILGETGVHTGTGGIGEWSGHDCLGWSSAASNTHGTMGFASLGRSPWWTEHHQTACDQWLRLYCFHNVVTVFFDRFESEGLEAWSKVVP